MSSSGYGFDQFGGAGFGATVIDRQILGPSLSAIYAGQAFQLQLRDSYSDGTISVVTAPVNWTSSDPTIATIDSYGNVSCLTTGRVTMTESIAGDISRSYTFTISTATIETIVVEATPSLVAVGQSAQMKATGVYSDGVTVDVTAQCAWSTNQAAASISSAGVLTSTQAGPVYVSAVFSDIYSSVGVGFVVPSTAPAGALTTFRSHRTQVLQNYFDIADPRVRETAYTIDAQLLNTAAMALDDSELRTAREVASRRMATCPTGLDNRGVYFRVPLPHDFQLLDGQTSLASVTGTTGGHSVALSQYDDRLPIPSSYTVGSAVALSSPVLLDITGSGDAKTQVWDPQVRGPFALAIPNTLTFWLEGVGANQAFLDIYIEGQEYPQPVWVDQRSGASESLTATAEGVFTSTRIWASVSQITVRGLPAGVRLRCWQMAFNLPAVLDAQRPYSHPVFRDRQFDRYWQINATESLLEELYMMDNFSALEPVQSYLTHSLLNDVAIEPWTWGMVAASGSSLLYWDRREPLPADLSVTGLTVEPFYGVDARRDISVPGPVRSVKVRPMPYGSSKKVAQWRYLLANPGGVSQIIQPDGSLIVYSRRAGWQTGNPADVVVPLDTTGTYVITMECRALDGTMTADSVPYLNLDMPVATVFNLSAFIPAIHGLAYDAFGQLWAWSGAAAFPVTPQYHAYTLDPASRSIYLTQPYDSVSFE